MKIKRIFSSLLAMLLCLSLVIGVMPMIPAVSAAEVTHCGHEGHGADWNVLTNGGALKGKYYLTDDITLTKMIETNGSLHICLNGRTITVGTLQSPSNYALNVSNGCTVTLCDCKGGGVINTAGSSLNRAPVYVQSGTTFNMYGGKITGTNVANFAGAVRLKGTMNMHGGEISGNTGTGTDTPGAILVDGGTFNMYGGSITGNTGYQGGAIYGSAGAVTINDGTISDNTVIADADKLSAEAIYMAKSTTLTINGGTISGNKLGSDTGDYSYPSTIHMYAATFVMTGGSISCGEAVNTVILNKDTSCTYNISGTAQIDTGCLRYWQATANSSIGALESGANVNVKRTELKVASGDTTVVKTVTGVDGNGSWVYSYNLANDIVARMVLGNNLDIQFAIPAELAASGVTINGAAATAVGTVEGGEYNGYQIYEAYVKSNEMTKPFEIAVQKDSKTYTKTESVQKYAMRLLGTTENAEVETLLVDMLNYGAEAQKYFDKVNTGLANANLSAEQQAAFENVTAEAKEGAARLQLLNSLCIQIDVGSNYAGKTLKYTFVPFDGTEALVYNAEVKEEDGVCFIVADQVVFADRNCVITVKDGETVVASDSVQNYVGRQIANPSNVTALAKALLKFADSAYAYLTV